MSPSPPLFSLPEVRSWFTNSTRDTLISKNIMPLLSTFSQLAGNENEKNCTLDQAFRVILEDEIVYIQYLQILNILTILNIITQ
uniref:DH domain-containing protein n=1 Tax=Monodelphis domestica TaxID=13616 RepID=A0A5F8H9K2_MONDO